MDIQSMLGVAWMLLGMWAFAGVLVVITLGENDAPRGAIVATVSVTAICAIGATVCAILAAGWPS